MTITPGQLWIRRRGNRSMRWGFAPEDTPIMAFLIVPVGNRLMLSKRLGMAGIATSALLPSWLVHEYCHGHTEECYIAEEWLEDDYDLIGEAP